MYRKTQLIVLISIALAFAGCKSVAKPDLYHPGTAVTQQNTAQRFDPYPQTEISSGMSDTRPRDYDKPVAEPVRARWQVGNVTQ